MFKDFIKKFFGFKSKTRMEKEIFEQPNIIKFLLNKYINKNDIISFDLPQSIKKTVFIASGSSFHSAATAANFISENTRLDARAYYSSEIALLDEVNVECDTLYIFISQSGETSDTNEALKKFAAKTDKTLALTNTKNSSLYNNAKYKMLSFAGCEKSVASTKAVSAQTFCLFIICARLMQLNNYPYKFLLDELNRIPETIKDVLKKADIVTQYSKILSDYNNVEVLATGMFYPLAQEAALKIKETSYINAAAYPAGEFLHGHVAVLNKKSAVISFINDDSIEFMTNVLKKIDADYQQDSLIVAGSLFPDVHGKTVIRISETGNIVFWFASLIVLQLLALKTATILERDPDNPNGLSKILKN